MSDAASPPFDLARAHRWFSADSFNRAWTLIEKPDRTADDNERMLSLAHASLAHWRERADCTKRILSIGYWQLSRVHAVLGQAENARHYGQLCLEVSAGEEPFHLGYAHEALARAAKLAGNAASAVEHLATARRLAAQVNDASERGALEADLAGLA